MEKDQEQNFDRDEEDLTNRARFLRLEEDQELNLDLDEEELSLLNQLQPNKKVKYEDMDESDQCDYDSCSSERLFYKNPAKRAKFDPEEDSEEDSEEDPEEEEREEDGEEISGPGTTPLTTENTKDDIKSEEVKVERMTDFFQAEPGDPKKPATTRRPSEDTPMETEKKETAEVNPMECAEETSM